MTTAWTDEQRQAIELREGDLLLDASAGSGKTSVLVERFVRAVLEDGVDVAAILAITFTEKAAAELRDRIRARLAALGAGEQARATEGAFISTIHGFCARVLRANALTAGLDPAFVVLEREQSGQLATAAFDEALVDLERADPDAASLLADYGAGPLRAAILAVYGQLRSQGQAEPRLPPAPPPPGPGAEAELEVAARAVAAELAEIAEPGPKVLEALGRLERCQELVAVPDLWPTELDRVRLPGNGSALSTDACGAYAEALTAYKAACAARAARPVRDRLDALLGAFGRHYRDGKRAVSGLDFEDLELVTLELLRSHGELRERYQQRFERIMVDELQDTNRVQLELIELISRDNLFTVGDAQQSIYRFRHADVELFERRGERLAGSGQRATLRTNHRSAPEILAALNVAFGEALGEQFRPLVAGRAAEASASSGAVEDGPDARTPRVELLLVDKGADWDLEGLASPWRLAEARALAGRVAELVQGGTAPGEIVVLIRATTDMRAYERALEQRGLPTYVIGGRGYWLHPQVLDLVSYLRALANPRDEEALYAVLASPLVGASLDALVVLAGEARGQGRDPWWLLSETGGRLQALDPADRELAARFVAWFSAERGSAPRRGLEALIDAALQQTGYDVAMLAMPGGRRRLANVRKLMRLAREYEGDHGPDLHGFLALVAERAAGRGGDARESEAPVEGEGLDAIRLMTIHRAKGLEFHTVCVADLGRSPRPPYQILRVDSDGRLGLRLARSGTGGRASALDYDAIGADEKAADEREERRLFYVAMTRARERLILSGATRFEGWLEGRFTGGGPVAWIAPAFVPELGQRIAEGGGTIDLGSAQVQLLVAAPEPGSPDSGAASAQPDPPVPAAGPSPPAPQPDPPAPAPRPPASPVSSLSYSALGAYARCGYRFYAERVLGLPAASEPEAGGTPNATEPDAGESPAARGATEPDAGVALGVRRATERGTLVHGLLERLNFRRPLPVSHQAVAAVAADEGLSAPTAEETRELAELVAAFAASELCARLGQATEVRREQHFAFLLEGSVLINGAIDVLAREPGGRVLVVDYKSDRLEQTDPAALVQSAYATQRLVYALAALHSGAERVDVAYCFLEIPERPVVVTYERSQLDELDRRLRGLADGVLRGEFAVTPTPHRAVCAGCPAEGGLCSWPLEMTRREAVDRLF